MCTIWSRPSAVSLELRGRQRTTTFTHSEPELAVPLALADGANASSDSSAAGGGAIVPVDEGLSPGGRSGGKTVAANRKRERKQASREWKIAKKFAGRWMNRADVGEQNAQYRFNENKKKRLSEIGFLRWRNPAQFCALLRNSAQCSEAVPPPEG